MNNPMEIVVSLKDGTSSQRVVQFSELHGLIDNIGSLMLLWNSNSYYVDCISKTFIINGGRRTRFNEMEDCKVIYRRRNQCQMSMSGQPGETHTIWIIGLESKKTGSMILIDISEDGTDWSWNTKL